MLLLMAVAYANAQSPKLLALMTFDSLQNTTKLDYGTKDNPILSGAFLNIQDMTQSLKFKNSYRWPDGQTIDFSKRVSKNDGKTILDCYTLVKPGTTDTIKLYVNPYKKADVYYVPQGLTALNEQLLAKELAPYLALVETLEGAQDASTLKEDAAKLLAYIGSSLGTKPFLDEALQPFLTDQTIDRELKGFLFRAYIFNKFYAYGKNISNESGYALGKMKANYQKFIALHSEVKTGGLAAFFK